MAFLRCGVSTFRDHFESLDPDARRRVVKFAVSIGCLIAAHRTCTFVYHYIEQRRARRKKLDQVRTSKGKLLQKLVGLKTPLDNRHLTTLSYAEMKKRLEKGDLTALDLLEAFQARSLDDTVQLNCVSEVIYEADVSALYVDALPKDQRGLLHGIPLTMSECLDVKGHDSTWGCASRCFYHTSRTHPVALALEKAGMALFARTNTPQYGISIGDCNNPLFGATLNPKDHKRLSGGAGGEGALIGAGGSIAGMAVDRTGSIRMSASFCGVFGFKPTAARIGALKLVDVKGKHVAGPLFHHSCVGPIASDLDLLVDMMRAIYSELYFDLNTRVPRLEFDLDSYASEKSMRIGLFKCLKSTTNLQPIPAVIRVLDALKSSLEQRGHTVVMFEPPDMRMISKLLMQPLCLDGGAIYRQISAYEMFKSKEVRRLRFVGALKRGMKTCLGLAAWIFSPLICQRLWYSRGVSSITGVMDLAAAIDDYCTKFETAWEEAGLDGLICPVTTGAAPSLTDHPLCVDPYYTMLFNMLDYPAGVVPAGKVTKADCDKLEVSYPRRDLIARKVIGSQKNAVGMPIGVQCVATKYRDEVALRLMGVVSEAVDN